LTQASDLATTSDAKALDEAVRLADAAEVQKTRAKIMKEIGIWTRFTSELENFNRVALGMKSEFLDTGRAQQRAAVESWQETTYPVRDFAELAHAVTFAQACGNRKFPDAAKTYKVFWLNSTALGYDALAGTMEAIQDLAALVAADPESTVLLVAAPTVGAFGNEYDETSIEESAYKIKQRLCNPDLRLLCRDVFLNFDPTSLPQQCKRPGVHKFFMAISDQNQAGALISVFANSTLWRRQTVPNACFGKVQLVPMLPAKNMVDARRDFTTAGASQGLSRPATRKQWIGGWHVAAAFHDSLWQGTGVDNSGYAMWVDLFAYDHSLAETLMRRSKDAAWPQQMYVGTVWADMGTRNPNSKGDAAAGATKACDCARVARWLQGQLRRKLHALATEGATLVPNWQQLPDFRDQRSAPQLNPADFTILHPAAAKNLPIRAEVMDMMETRLQTPESKSQWQEIVKEHNESWNPSGKAWENKRKSEGTGAGAAKKARLVEHAAGQPETLAELEEKCGKCVTIPFENGLQLFIPTDVAGIWAQCEEDSCITDLTKPLALVFGQFKVGEATMLHSEIYAPSGCCVILH
jgi:hypothetical protein